MLSDEEERRRQQHFMACVLAERERQRVKYPLRPFAGPTYWLTLVVVYAGKCGRDIMAGSRVDARHRLVQIAALCAAAVIEDDELRS